MFGKAPKLLDEAFSEQQAVASPIEPIVMLSCPFCGGEAKAEYVNMAGGWIAGCKNDLCAIGHAGRLSGDKDKSIRFWNSRAS